MLKSITLAVNLSSYNSRSHRILRHVLFWTAFVLFYGLIYGSFEENYGEMIAIQLIYLPAKMLAAYTVIYYLMPKYFNQGKYTEFFLGVAVVLLVTGFMNHATYKFFEGPIIMGRQVDIDLIYPAKIIKGTISIYPVVALAVLIKLFQSFYQSQKQQQKLAQDKLEAELKFLKSQVHPHFLFNTLNNLYALTLKKSEKAPEIVLRLSDLLNYMLYECNVPYVGMDKEFDMLRNYISLEKLRYGDRLTIKDCLNGEIDQQTIAPMILLPFVENAFKHGVSEQTGDAWVNITTDIKGDELCFRVENSKNHISLQKSEGVPEGIGLKNVKRRLELLYKERYQLEITDKRDSYEVELKLDLSHE